MDHDRLDREEIPGLNVKTDGDVTVITMKSGDPGWPDYGIGLRKAGDSERNDFDRAMDWAASAAANKMMGEWFWVVPDNSELKRSVRIDVIDDEKKVIASTPCDQKPCMPTMTIGKTFGRISRATTRGVELPMPKEASTYD